MELFKRVRLIRLVFLALMLAWLSGCKTYHPMDEALAALQGSDQVTVTEDALGIYFAPQSAADQGFIFYPGAGVKPAAYAPLALQLAEVGFTTIIARFPLNLALLAPNRADALRARFAGVSRWTVGGHSLGGVMAAQYLDQHPDDAGLNGLILFAAYPANANDLSDTAFNALSLSASEDGLTSPQDIAASAQRMPPNTVFEEIAGGNHAQFGWYGPQDGDGMALISREDQALLIRDQVIAFLSGD